MRQFTEADSAYMARALRLAERGRYSAHPNPMVGCVLVKNGRIVGEGWHERPGGPHAEVAALIAAGEAGRGASVYVTLEPCAHHGKTPPCTDALIAAGVAEVTVAMRDPFRPAASRGIEVLAAAGIPTRTGLLHGAALALNSGFVSRIERRRPFVRVKIASSMDGAIAMEDGTSQWITGAAARADVQRLRARSGAVLTGIGTVLADDPSLNVRDETLASGIRQPLRAIMDSRLRMPRNASMLVLPGSTLLYCIDDARAEPLEQAGATVIRVRANGHRVDLAAVLEDLARRAVNDVLVEAGPAVAGNLLEQNLVDELVLYQAPCLMGDQTLRMFGTPRWSTISDRLELDVTDVRRVGPDIRFTARPRKTAR